MSNLLQIEANFLRRPEVSAALKLSEVRSIQRTITNSKKKKFEASLELSGHVAAAFKWFKSAEGKATLTEEGIAWTAEAFASKVFGFQKSYFYKLVKVAELPTEVIETYRTECDNVGEDAQRSVEELLKFSRELSSGGQDGEGGGQDGEGGGEVPARPSVVLSLTYGEVRLKVFSDGRVKGNASPEQLVDIAAFINGLAVTSGVEDTENENEENQ